MTKILKKTFVFLIGLFAFLGAGFLFAGCGVDYSKISLVCDVKGAIELEVGNETEVTFKILGYQKGFSSEIKVDCKSEGQTKIFEEIKTENVSNSEIKVTIRAIAGGVGQIYAKTLEAGKECYVDISVSQTSSSMQRENNLLYVSNSTPFAPDSSLFKFDANTTIKDVAFYYMKKPASAIDDDLSTYEIKEYDFDGVSPYVLFKNSLDAYVNVSVYKFQKISLSDEYKIVLDENETNPFDLASTFDILSVYNPSLGAEKLVYCVSEVNVLPDISASVYGGYIVDNVLEFDNKFYVKSDDVEEGKIGKGKSYYFDKEFSNEAGKLEKDVTVTITGTDYIVVLPKTFSGLDPIVIVPNNSSKREYLLKIEVENAPAGSPINIDKTALNHYIDIDFINVSTESERYLNDTDYKAFVDALLEDEVAGKKYYYLKISQNARTQIITPFAINIFYDIAQNIGDDSINFVADMLAEIQIAPTAVLINGSQSPDRLTLYNYYRYPEFGWNELDISVVSGMDETPNIEGIYFDFDDTLLEITYQGVMVRKGEANLYSDLTDSFYIRGKQGCPQAEGLEVKVFVISDVLEEELDPAILTCDIVAGATRISRNTASDVFYVDYLDGKNQGFNHQLYADQVFQYFTYRKIGGTDVVELDLSDDVYKQYEGEEDKYFLDILLSPKAEGVGIYRLYLDNGMSIDLTFSVIGTLKSETTHIEIHDSDTKVHSSSSKSNDSEYVDVFEYEILNPSDNQSVSFGNNLNLEIVANIDATGGIDVPDGDFNGKDIISVRTSGNILNVRTLENGEASFKLVLKGSKVKKTEEGISFELEPAQLEYKIKIHSYSKASEFYLLNGGNLALNNVVYYSKNDTLLRDEDRSVEFDTYVKNENINNFYKYDFINESIEDMFEEAREKPIYRRDDRGEIIYDGDNPVIERMDYDYSVVANQIDQKLLYEKFDNKFVYFYVVATGAVFPKLNVRVTKYTHFNNDGTPSDPGETKEIVLVLPQGLIFKPDDEIKYEILNDDETLAVRYVAEFVDKTFVFDMLGEFNADTFTYTNTRTGSYGSNGIQFTAYLSQRDQTKTYTAKIVSNEYLSTEAISLSSGLTSLDFQHDILSYDLGVYTFPNYATNKEISIDFVTTNGSKYTNLLTPNDFVVKKLGNGAFNITISCRNFVDTFESIYRMNIIDAEDIISGKLYIYPSDWGANYSMISGALSPICLDVSYRNGSRKNPYLISSAEDLKNINLSKQKLNSHYEVRTNVDLSSVENFVPIGIFNDGENDEIVGFGGTITGTTSIAGFSNVRITNTNFSKVLSNVLYAGLFAQLNGPTEKAGTGVKIYQTAQIENLVISGDINLDIVASDVTSANVGLLTAINKGNIVNTESDLQASVINATATLPKLNFGGLAGTSTGRILQDIRAYEGRKAQDGEYFEVYDISQVYKDGDNFVCAFRENGEVVFKYVDEYGYLLNGAVRVKNAKKVYTGIQDFEGQTPRKMANYLDTLTISGTINDVFAGGVVGYGNGVVERLLPENDDFKLFGYMAYSAITNINVVSSSNNIHLGGIIGKYVLDDGYFKDFGLKLQNLLVGGEVSSFDAVLGTDNVGGIAGTIDTKTKAIVYVLSNKVRTFVRAQKYAGAVVGYEIYADATYLTNHVYYIQGDKVNTIEAVDDGRGVFFSSQVVTGVDGAQNAEHTGAKVAIGNATYVTRNYSSTANNLSASFSLVSYSERIVLAPASNVNLADQTKSTTYGDRITVERVDGAVNVTSKIEYPRQSVIINAVSATDTLDYEEGGTTYHAYLMYYFDLTGTLISGDGLSLQRAMDVLNVVSPQSRFYPFSLNNSDVVLNVSASNILSVDASGNINVKTTGLSTIVLSSILNVNKVQNVNIYVFNYFNKNVDGSIFYSGKSIESLNVSNNSTIVVYGNSTTSLNIIPSYYLESASTIKGADDTFKISKDGKLSYGNQTYLLAKNSEISADIKKRDGEYFSYAQVNKQTISFSKNGVAGQGDKDEYTLVPSLTKMIKVNGVAKAFKMTFGDNAKININVEYREVAAFIASGEDNYAIDTNGCFEDEIKVVSTNPSEFVFYQITKTIGGIEYIVQERLPDQSILQSLIDDETYLNYINFRDAYSSDKNLYQNYIFKLDLSRKSGATNYFVMNISVDKDSYAFTNRADMDIYGEYKVRLFASQLEEGIDYIFSIWLSEAQVNYLDMKNYSNIHDVVVDDKKIIPSQQGLLEISIDPAEAVFDRFEIENDAQNSLPGANNANFTFAYEKITNGEVEYALAPNFGRYENGKLSFSYLDMMQFYEDVHQKYNGKIYVSYILPSSNIENGVEIKFNAKVIFDNGAQEERATSILTTKLSNFVKVSFTDKKPLDEKYYVARGLSYGLDLSLFGYNESQIEFSYSNSFVSVEKQNGKYTLSVTSEAIPYNVGDNGFWTEVYVTAKKEIDGVLVISRDTLSFYIMEYVLNYAYVEGEFEDLVERVNNGVLSTSIGNPVALKFAINQMIEFDRTSETIRQEVEFFATKMTNDITWKVWKNDTPTQIGGNVSIKDEYYLVEGLVVTPIRLYQPESDIYHFSLSGNYKISGGIYVSGDISTDSNKIYTEFAFEVHDQSTEDSPIPIRTYEDFVGMNVGEWYILLNDIVLPSSEYATTNNIDQFVPFDKQIAGLDGNGYEIIFNGTYNFDEQTEIGVFSQVYAGEILKNIKVKISGNTTFNVSAQTFDVGILTAINNGIITNCESVCASDKVFSVTSSVATTDSYVAGLVGENNSSGVITNSRSKVVIYAYENIGGFVGKNAGHIASSYFMGAIKNQSTASVEKTAGFAVENTGKIFTSYVSGVPYQRRAYYDGEKNNYFNTIQSSGNVAGFVYTNDGDDAKIADCYSNILLKQSSAFASGFVFENSGNIERCFSTSVLDNSQNSNYGFVRTNRITTGTGTILNCFFLQDASENINTNISVVDGVDVKPLTLSGFGDTKNFSAFSYTQGRRTNSVWFFNNEDGRAENFDGQIFNTGRLELVAPNIIAQSRRNLSSIDEIEDGDMTIINYVYSYDSSYPALGSMYNPILISSAEEMEKYIKNETSVVGYNYSAYRLISNVDYTTYQSNSALYKTKFLGYFEGNFLSITGTSLTSSEVLESAGLFAQVGSSSVVAADGTLLNFTFTPKIVSFANTMVVGALVGTLDGGNVINVEVLLGTTEKIVVTGYNIVGGVIGLSKGNFAIENVYSELSAKSRNSAIKDTDDIEALAGQYQYCSYAGSIVGAVAGQGRVKNTIINRDKLATSNISVMGRKVGLAFGFVGQNVVVQDAEINITNNMIINAYGYGGFLAGESRGKIENIRINPIQGEFLNFRKIPNIPVGIGGIAGLVSGGEIVDVVMSQSFSISEQGANAGVESVGGLVGEISNTCKISNVSVIANVTGYQYVGGLVGSVLEGSGNVNFEDVKFEGDIKILGLSVPEIGVGGLAGRVEQGAIISTTSSCMRDEEYLNQNHYEQLNAETAGTYAYILKTNKEILSVLVNDTTGINTMFERLEQCRNDVRQAELDMAIAEHELANIDDTTPEGESAKQAKQQEIGELSENIAHLTAEIEFVKGYLIGLKENVSDAFKVIIDLILLNDYEIQINNAKEDKTTAEQELANLTEQTEIDAKKGEINALKTLIETLTDSAKPIKNELTGLKSSVSNEMIVIITQIEIKTIEAYFDRLNACHQEIEEAETNEDDTTELTEELENIIQELETLKLGVSDRLEELIQKILALETKRENPSQLAAANPGESELVEEIEGIINSLKDETKTLKQNIQNCINLEESRISSIIQTQSSNIKQIWSNLGEGFDTTFTSNISIGVYVYGTGIGIYVGGIIGRDKANGNHSIAYTKSNISIAGFAFDLSSSQGTKTITETDTEYTTTYTRTASETTYKLSASIQISIGSGSTSSSGSRMYLLDFGTQET